MFVSAAVILVVAVVGFVVSFAGARRENSMVAMIGMSVTVAASFPAVAYALIDGT